MKKLNINCPIGTTGYGITSLNIVKALHNRNIDVSLFLIGNNISVNFAEESGLIQSLHSNGAFFDYESPCLKIWHQNDLAAKIGKGDYYVFPFFELDTLSSREKHHLNFADYIFVASNWAKEILLKNSISKPIYVAPLGVDSTIFKNTNLINIKESNNYVFCHIGKWEKRKGQDFLIEAFNKAFDINDNVELRLVPHNPFLNEQQLSEWYSLIKNSKLKDKIKVYDRLPTQIDLSRFISQVDCCIFPSRAEGWNNEIPECMALNKPIITTNYSAHTEYCTKHNSFLIEIDQLELANDGKWFFGEGNWAKLGSNQLEQTIEHMKYVYNNNVTTNENGLKTANHYSWKNTCSIIDDIITRNNSYANT
jgi:glycosyltransferase involved in cell wall biosynthesis